MPSIRGADRSYWPAPASRSGAGAGCAVAFLACLVAWPAPSHAAEDPYLAALVDRARALGLADAPRWRSLLHYHAERLRPGLTSQADDPDFFLAEDGRRNPQSELAATLRAFFAPAAAEGGRQHPQCAFAARYRWLDEQLAFAPARLAPQPCPELAAWRRAMRATGMTLVFPESFMNNPASMFGHTLLRVDTDDDPDARDLLAWAVNFAGATGNEGGPLYAVKGIFGFYQGFFAIAPYYEKIKEYGDWENRDIWEYRLDFTPEEIDRVLLHLWELQGIAFDYYYFDENCSQQLLALLEVARPGLRTSEFIPPWVIPSNTVRAVVDAGGPIAGVVYRPSAATELRQHARALPRDQRRLARRIADGALAPDAASVAALSDEDRAAVLTLAYDSLRYAYLAGNVERDESLPRSRSILIARSQVSVQGSPFEPVETPATRPDEGHATARFALGGGWQDGESFVEARIRPALHDLMDPEGGYTRGAQIEFLDLAVRYFPESQRVRFQEAVLLDIVSLVPWDGFFRPISFRFDTGLRTRLLPHGGGGSHLRPEPVWRTRAGLGLAFDLGAGMLGYGMLEATGDVGPDLDRSYALGAGGSVGVFLPSPSDRWRGHLFAEATRFPLGDTSTALRAGFEQRVTLTRNTALEVDTTYERDFGRGWLDAEVRLNLYF